VAANIRALAPDLACVQEAPRFLFSRRKCAALARAAGMTVLTGGRSTHGNLLLAGPRVHPVSTTRVRLPRSGRRHRRALALATVDVDGAWLVLAGTHLSLDPDERLKQAVLVAAQLDASSHEVPGVVLGADVNDVPGSQVWAALTASLRDAHATAPVGGALTFPARGPDRRLDGVFVSAAINVVGCGVPPGLSDPASATDHLPVVADLEMPVDPVV